MSSERESEEFSPNSSSEVRARHTGLEPCLLASEEGIAGGIQYLPLKLCIKG